MPVLPDIPREAEDENHRGFEASLAVKSVTLRWDKVSERPGQLQPRSFQNGPFGEPAGQTLWKLPLQILVWQAGPLSTPRGLRTATTCSGAHAPLLVPAGSPRAAPGPPPPARTWATPPWFPRERRGSPRPGTVPRARPHPAAGALRKPPRGERARPATLEGAGTANRPAGTSVGAAAAAPRRPSLP